jgi:hypothetical protein
LGRNFRVAVLNWGPLGLATQLAFPGVFHTIPAIETVMSLFKFYRASVKVEVRLNTTQFHFGAIMLSYISNCTFASAHHNGILQQSGNNPIVLSACTQQAATFVIPWTSPFLYDVWINSLDMIGRMYITSMTDLNRASDTVPDTVELQVYAALIDIDVAGYKVAPPLAVSESSNVPKVRNAFGSVHAPGDSIPVENAIAEHTDEEADTKAKVGVMDIVESKIVQALPIFGGIASIASGFLNIGKGVVKLIGLFDKPTNKTIATRYFDNAHCDMPNSIGTFNGVKISLHPDANLKPISEEMGDSQQVHGLREIAMIPMLHDLFEFTATTDVLTIRAYPSLPSLLDINQPDYLFFVTNLFEYWRGDIKYKLFFYTSMFITCRFRLSVVWTTDAIDDTNYGDIISTIIDVKGDTEYEFTIPYCWPTMWRRVGDHSTAAYDFPRLILQPIVEPVGLSIADDPIIYCAVWRAAGENFQWSQLIEPVRTPSYPDLPAVSESDVKAQFRKPFPYIIEGCKSIVEDGFCTPEHPNTVNEIQRRFYPRSAAEFYPDPANFPLSPWQYLNSIFRYFRGSVNFKDFVASGIVSLDPNASGQINFARGGYVANSGSSGVFLQVPYYQKLPFLPVRVPDQPLPNGFPAAEVTSNTRFVSSGFSVAHRFISAGDDFQLGYVAAPVRYVPISSENGVSRRPKARNRNVPKLNPSTVSPPTLTLPSSSATTVSVVRALI